MVLNLFAFPEMQEELHLLTWLPVIFCIPKITEQVFDQQA